MADAPLVESISQKFRAILADLDERGNRRWAAAEAISLGRGGIVRNKFHGEWNYEIHPKTPQIR